MSARSVQISPLAAATLALLALAVGAAAQQGSAQVTPPSQDFVGSAAGVKVYRSPDALLHMRAHYIPHNPEIQLTSIHSHPSGTKKIPAVIKTAFWPTSVRPIDNGLVLVCGKNRRNGATIIEVWTLHPPTLSAASTPGAPSTMIPGSIADINPVYSADEAGKRLVRRAIPQYGVSGGAIIQFDDSRDVYALNISTAVMTPVASPDATRALSLGCTHAPLLTQTGGAAASELVQGGYVYEFRVRESAGDAPSRLMFLDLDKNGTIDSLQTLTTNQWTAAGYADPSVWVARDF